MLKITNKDGVSVFEFGNNKVFRKTEFVSVDWNGVGYSNKLSFYYLGLAHPFCSDLMDQIEMDGEPITPENADSKLRAFLLEESTSSGEEPKDPDYNLVFKSASKPSIAVATASKEDGSTYYFEIPSGSKITEQLNVTEFVTLTGDYSFSAIVLSTPGNIKLENLQLESLQIDQSGSTGDTTMNLVSCVANKFTYKGNPFYAVSHILQSCVMTEASLDSMKIHSLVLQSMNFNSFRKMEFQNCQFENDTLDTLLQALSTFNGTMTFRYVDSTPTLSDEQKENLPSGITVVDS